MKQHVPSAPPPAPAEIPVRILQLQVGPFPLSFETVACFDETLDQYARDSPDNTDLIPYFADIWPSAIALANALIQHPEWVRQHQVLELGSGLGLPSIIAARLDAASVTATDFHPACLPFLQANTRRNQAPNIQCQYLDWRSPPTHQTYDCILGSDLLYEPQQVKTLVSCIQTLCAPHGTLILADPLRKHLQDAISQLEACGFTCHTSVLEDTVILTAHPPDIT